MMSHFTLRLQSFIPSEPALFILWTNIYVVLLVRKISEVPLFGIFRVNKISLLRILTASPVVVSAVPTDKYRLFSIARVGTN